MLRTEELFKLKKFKTSSKNDFLNEKRIKLKLLKKQLIKKFNVYMEIKNIREFVQEHFFFNGKLIKYC
jgi:hypothetical protein